MEQHTFWTLLARKLAGEASLRDLYELDKAIFKEPKLQFIVRLVTELWRNKEAIEKEPGGEETFLRLIQEAYVRKYLHEKTAQRKKCCFFTGKLFMA